MSRTGLVLSASLLLAVVVIAALSVGCSAMNSSNRVLQSIAVTPANADAQGSAMGQVQFTATGTFSKPPSPALVPFVDPYSGSWMVSNTKIASISQNGMAQCVSGASGTVTVTAIASSNSAMGMGQMSTAVSGTAKLTCP
ncbi:MAG TPA: hypothetical protein VGR48_07525 [Terriglobales bacterium]|nr:hypothetical protein [Terriglobales bacterium]